MERILRITGEHTENNWRSIRRITIDHIEDSWRVY